MQRATRDAEQKLWSKQFRAVPLFRLKSHDSFSPPLFIYLFILLWHSNIIWQKKKAPAFHLLINFINAVIIFGSAADWLCEARAARVEPEIIALDRDAETKADN